MTVYSIFSKPENGPEAIEPVPDRFIWTAALLTPVWALAKRAWRLLIAWLAVVLGLWASGPFLGDDAAIVLYIVFALWCGFAAPVFAMRALTRRGWIANGELVAGSDETALSYWLSATYGAGR